MKCLYKIVNEENGKFYLGHTVDYETRKSKHLSDLRKGKQNNHAFQKDYDKYGEDAFTFEIIQKTPNMTPDEMHAKEKAILRKIWSEGKWDTVYNRHAYRTTPQHERESGNRKVRRKIAKGNLKLSVEDVKEIKRRYDKEDISQNELADEYGVVQSQISQIVNEKRCYLF